VQSRDEAMALAPLETWNGLIPELAKIEVWHWRAKGQLNRTQDKIRCLPQNFVPGCALLE